jgi:hypothetical protein
VFHRVQEVWLKWALDSSLAGRGKRPNKLFPQGKLLAPIVVLLMMGLVSLPSQAAIFEFQSEITYTKTLWQTRPPAFSGSAQWAGIGISLLLRRFTFGMNISVIDFETLRLSNPVHHDFYAFFKVLGFWKAGVNVGGGLVVAPAVSWVSWYVATRVSVPLGLNLEAATEIGVQTTKGSPGSFFRPGSPAGTCLYIDFGLSWSIPIPPFNIPSF